jgi:succinate dehydrogenase/fumarate reductase flavoprotein subunit
MSETLKLEDGTGISMRRISTLVIGSGAAGLNAAIQLDNQGVADLALYTEGARAGTSINTGSDKQTYYKLGMYGAEPDSPAEMAASLFNGGSMHGDVALIESALSTRAFFNLVNLGVPFPTDAFGQYVGYKTDHDPSRRATSVGPRTSRIMCVKLLEELSRRKIEMVEKRVAVSLITIGEGDAKRACGAVFAVADANNADDLFEVVLADNVVFAVGGPGGLYSKSVYPKGHTGAIGLALMEGAEAVNLPESQYGLASIKFRWNVSGTYMQSIPRFISVDGEGGDEREFLRPFFESVGEMNSAVFLKGYQWPFDPAKVRGGSSLIDLLVYRETEKLGRRVYLDFTRNPAEFAFDELSEEARGYLENSNALSNTPIERLRVMNPEAIELYQSHNIDITREPLEIAVCAQHNNGGLAADVWWESTNIRRLFPIGEVCGTHGVSRPGGTALNSGQVAGFRVAELISKKYRGNGALDLDSARLAAARRVAELRRSLDEPAPEDWRSVRKEIGDRMSEFASHMRSEQDVAKAAAAAWELFGKLKNAGIASASGKTVDVVEALRNRQLCHAHAVYLDSILFSLRQKVGSRGSALALISDGLEAHEKLGSEWRFAVEDESFKTKLLVSVAEKEGEVFCRWIDRHPIPVSDAWFENVWREFRENIHLTKN